MIVFCCVLPESNKARDDDDDDKQERQIEVGYQKFAIFNQYLIVSRKRCQITPYGTLIGNYRRLLNCVCVSFPMTLSDV